MEVYYMDNSGEKFLIKLYKDALTKSDIVNHRTNSKDPIVNVKKYMERLERIHDKALDKKHIDLIKKYYYEKYLIKEENIKEQDLVNETPKSIIEKQKNSLDSWMDYLITNRGNYPTWAKYWAFQGMLKMGVLDDDLGKYNKRSKNTSKPFVECNAEILAHTIDLMVKYTNNRELPDEEVNRLVETGSFSKIYGTLLIEYNKNKRERSFSKDGIWAKYNQGSKEDAKKLYDSLQGYNTGWCTAGDIQTAERQICGPYSEASHGGDFYVFYTIDENNEYKVPRIAIRMINNDAIEEIRGILEHQCLEEGLEDIVENKLNSIENLKEESKKSALQQCINLKQLSQIVKKTHNNEELTIEELELLYSEEKIGFGWEQDKRIIDCIKYRGKKGYIEKDINKSDIIKKRIIKGGYFEYSENLRTDRTIVLEAVKQNGLALKYASEELRNDRTIVLEALKQYVFALEYASEELRNDREFVLEAVKQYAYALEYASADLRNDREFVLEAVKQNVFAFKYASKELRNDREFVLEAVKQGARALVYASEELCNDRELAVKQDELPDHFEYKYTSKESSDDNNQPSVLEDFTTTTHIYYVDLSAIANMRYVLDRKNYTMTSKSK